jgi:hypothetical protein
MQSTASWNELESDHILECTDKDDEVMSGWVNEECKR